MFKKLLTIITVMIISINCTVPAYSLYIRTSVLSHVVSLIVLESDNSDSNLCHIIYGKDELSREFEWSWEDIDEKFSYLNGTRIDKREGSDELVDNIRISKNAELTIFRVRDEGREFMPGVPELIKRLENAKKNLDFNILGIILERSGINVS